jgi:hypothetical protein
MNPDEIELLTRRITDQVTISVRASLFKFYAVVGTVAITVAGASGWQIYRAEVKAFVNETTASIRDQMADLTKKAQQQAAETAEKEIAVDITNQRSIKTLNAIDDTLRDIKPKLMMFETTQERLDQADENIKDIMARIERATETLAQIESLSEQVINTADHLTDIDKKLASLTDAKTVGSALGGTVGIAPDDIVKNTRAIQKAVSETAKATIVYFQYSGMSSETADQFISALKAVGFIAPGKEKVAMSASGERSIRYYYTEDFPEADRLQEIIQPLLNEMTKDSAPIKLMDLTNWPNRKPPLKTIELWIGLPDPTAAN